MITLLIHLDVTMTTLPIGTRLKCTEEYVSSATGPTRFRFVGEIYEVTKIKKDTITLTQVKNDVLSKRRMAFTDIKLIKMTTNGRFEIL